MLVVEVRALGRQVVAGSQLAEAKTDQHGDADDERRELYDSAIEFELSNGSPDAAWKYVQKYQAKLFLEFLAAFNPKVSQTRTRLDRSEVQRRMP